MTAHPHSAAAYSPEEIEDHDRGLSADLPLLLSRRNALTALGGLGLLGLAGCATSSGGTGDAASSPAVSSTPAAGSSTSTAGTGAAAQIPEETNGPYPADGSNGRNVLNQSGVVRSDLTASFGSASGVVSGVPLTVRFTVLNLSAGAAPYAGAALYAWHCTPDGLYSMYSPGVEGENFLRGVQQAAADGTLTFTTIYPGAYSGRWPHIHFEVYPSLDDAVNASSRLRTSQLALPEDACNAVYATDGYGDSARNMTQTSLDSDQVFGDGWSLQLATMTGSVSDGYTAALTVPV